MSDSASTPKPAIAVTPDAATAAPVRRYAATQRLDRVVAGEPLLAVALGQQHAELGRDRDHERAERDRHRVQRHPHGEQDQRRPSGRQHDRHERHQRAPAIAAEGEQQHERDRREPDQQRLQAPPRVGDLRPRLGRRAPAGRRGLRCTPAGGCRLERICSISRCCWSGPSGGCRTRASPTRRSGVITSWEKYGGIAPSRPSISRCVSLARVRSRRPGSRTGRAARRPGTGEPCCNPWRSCSRSARARPSGSRSSIRSSPALVRS